MCAKPNFFAWCKELPSDLQADAYKPPNSREFAWPRDAALDVLKFLEAHHYTVIGVDVWTVGERGPKVSGSFVYDWQLRPEPRADLHPNTAYEFIKTFQWDIREHDSIKESEPMFNIWAEPTT
jgi:hypothetical protein